MLNHKANTLLKYCSDNMKSLLYFITRTEYSMCVVGSSEEDRLEFIKAFAFEMHNEGYHCSTPEMCDFLEDSGYPVSTEFIDFEDVIKIDSESISQVSAFCMNNKILTEASTDNEFVNIGLFVDLDVNSLISYEGSVIDFAKKVNDNREIKEEKYLLPMTDKYYYIVEIDRKEDKLVVNNIFFVQYNIGSSEYDIVNLMKELSYGIGDEDDEDEYNDVYEQIADDLKLYDKIKFYDFVSSITDNTKDDSDYDSDKEYGGLVFC